VLVAGTVVVDANPETVNIMADELNTPAILIVFVVVGSRVQVALKSTKAPHVILEIMK
jgi:hypothetical protein